MSSHYHTLGCHRRLKRPYKEQVLWGHTLHSAGLVGQAFSRSLKCGAGESLESWYSLSLPSSPGWYCKCKSFCEKVPQSHLRHSQSLQIHGLRVCLQFTHVCAAFNENKCPAPCWSPKENSPDPVRLVCQSRTQTLGRLIRGIKYNDNNNDHLSST